MLTGDVDVKLHEFRLVGVYDEDFRLVNGSYICRISEYSGGLFFELPVYRMFP
jgi:hypothetical protein